MLYLIVGGWLLLAVILFFAMLYLNHLDSYDCESKPAAEFYLGDIAMMVVFGLLFPVGIWIVCCMLYDICGSMKVKNPFA
jgi:hypothetical protein